MLLFLTPSILHLVMQAIDVALGIYHIKDMKRPINHPNGHDLHALLNLKSRRI